MWRMGAEQILWGAQFLGSEHCFTVRLIGISALARCAMPRWAMHAFENI